jgi:aryl-alcohol dehydrogenase-like predicted oxidoreductase
MRYRLLGPSGLRISEALLGTMTFAEQGGEGAPIDECRRMVDAYTDAGGNVIDTASNYRGGSSEEIVGELLEGRRDRYVVATKFTVIPAPRRRLGPPGTRRTRPRDISTGRLRRAPQQVRHHGIRQAECQ